MSVNAETVACPRWGDLGHNWLQGGYAWWRDWTRLRPWRKWHVCTGCGFEQYDNGATRRPPAEQYDGEDA